MEYSHAELVSHANTARECGADAFRDAADQGGAHPEAKCQADYLHFLALYDKLGEVASAAPLRPLDRLYPQPNKESPLQQLVIQLANPLPCDREETRLGKYRRLVPRWHDWKVVQRPCAASGTSLFHRLARWR
jgi:hypothetical protein